MIRKLIPLIALVVVQGALAQTPDAPPPWKQGISEEQTKSTLHPFAPVLTGVDAKDLPISSLKVPAGFKVEVWMEGVTNARSMIQSPQGTVYVSNRNGKNVYAIVEKDGKRVMKTVAKGLDTPNGIAMIDGTLYIAERGRIVKLENIESLLDNPPEPVQVVDGLDPTNGPGHFWKYMVAGPDKKLYFNIGSPQNILSLIHI